MSLFPSLSGALFRALWFGHPIHLESALDIVRQLCLEAFPNIPGNLNLAAQLLTQALAKLRPDSELDAVSTSVGEVSRIRRAFDQASAVRRPAVDAICTIGEPLCVEVLLTCVSAEHACEEVFALAASGLARLRETRGIDPLCRALRSSSDRVREVAADALRSYRDPQVDARLSVEEAARDQQARREAEEARQEAEALRRQQQPRLEEARRLLAPIVALDPNERERWAERIAQFGDKAIAQLLLDMIRKDYESGVVEVGKYLKQNGGTHRMGNVATMVGSLCHSDAHVLHNLFIYWHAIGRLM